MLAVFYYVCTNYEQREYFRMANHYIFPEKNFIVDLKLNIKVNHVGDWKGLGTVDELQKKFDEMVKSGEFLDILKEHISEGICNNTYDSYAKEFDRLSFEIESVE